MTSPIRPFSLSAMIQILENDKTVTITHNRVAVVIANNDSYLNPVMYEAHLPIMDAAWNGSEYLPEIEPTAESVVAFQKLVMMAMTLC